MKLHFKPEFLNRVDETIIFNPLTREHIGEIVKNQLVEVALRLKERGISLEITPKALNFLAEEGYDPQFGARPLKRAVQRLVLNPLSVELLAGNLSEGAEVKLDLKGKELVFS